MNPEDLKLELAGSTKRDLIVIAKELRIVGRHRMKKKQLIEAIALSQIYKSLQESPKGIHSLKRRDLLKLCKLFKIKGKKGPRKTDLIKTIQATLVKEKSSGEPGTPGPRPSEQEKIRESNVVLLSIDPYLVHVLWNITPQEFEKAKGHVGRSFPQAKVILRFYDITCINFDGTNAHGSFDIEIDLEAENWYVHLWSPEKSYCVDLGLMTKDGRFFPIGRSNVVQTPSISTSLKTDEHYMRVEGDYENIEIIPQEREVRRKIETPRPTSQGKLQSALGSNQSAEPAQEVHDADKPKSSPVGVDVRSTKKMKDIDLTEICEKAFVEGLSS